MGSNPTPSANIESVMKNEQTKKYPISRQVSRQEARVLAKIAQYARTKFSPTNVRHVEVDIKGRSKYWPHCGKKEIERGKHLLIVQARTGFYYSLTRQQRRAARRYRGDDTLGDPALAYEQFQGLMPTNAQMGE